MRGFWHEYLRDYNINDPEQKKYFTLSVPSQALVARLLRSLRSLAMTKPVIASESAAISQSPEIASFTSFPRNDKACHRERKRGDLAGP